MEGLQEDHKSEASPDYTERPHVSAQNHITKGNSQTGLWAYETVYKVSPPQKKTHMDDFFIKNMNISNINEQLTWKTRAQKKHKETI